MSRARDLADLGGSADAGGLTGRNLIINGAMQVAQRGTSQSSTGYGSIDRWMLALSGATATLSQESFTLGQTDVVGAEYYAKVDVTTGNNNCGLYYKVEAKDVINAGGQEVTLSYWAKGTSPTNGLSVGLLLVATGGSAAGDQVVTLTSTWTKYTHTFTMPSFSGVTLNASSYLELHFDQDAGDTGTAAWELNIAEVQLELGETATPFEHRSYGDELARCQRYFFRNLATFFGMPPATSTTQISSTIQYPVEMRANPTFSASGTPKADPYVGGSITASGLTIAFFNTSKLTAAIQFSNFSGLSNSDPYNVQDTTVSLDAEL
jgi:hypothetical protein